MDYQKQIISAVSTVSDRTMSKNCDPDPKHVLVNERGVTPTNDTRGDIDVNQILKWLHGAYIKLMIDASN